VAEVDSDSAILDSLGSCPMAAGNRRVRCVRRVPDDLESGNRLAESARRPTSPCCRASRLVFDEVNRVIERCCLGCTMAVFLRMRGDGPRLVAIVRKLASARPLRLLISPTISGVSDRHCG
jgi:hypothetical protein